MTKVNVLIHPAPGPMQRSFGILPGPLTLARVPCVGEILALGQDDNGHAADYMVTLVHHLPREIATTDVEAEIYAVRVNLTAAIQGAAALPNSSILGAGAPLKLPLAR